MFRSVLLVVLSAKCLAGIIPPDSPPKGRILVPLGANRTITINGLRRAALANPKIARARAVLPHQLLLTAKSKGQTVLRTWSANGAEQEFLVEVLPAYVLNREGRGVVRVAFQFLELGESGRRNTGLRWPEILSATGTGVVQGTEAGAAFSYTLGLGGARWWLQQLVQEGHAKLLANPEIFVRLGEQARFSSGGEIPVPSTSEAFGRLRKHVEWKPFGVDVRVRPESSDFYHLHSDIEVEMSEVNPSQAIDGIPGLSRRKLSTKINSIDGETVMLSGLLRRMDSDQEDGLPVLKDIPVLGGIFSGHVGSKELQEILMAVTFSIPSRADVQDRWQGFSRRFGEMP